MSSEDRQDRGRPHPIDKMWFVPRILFMWCNEIIRTSRKTAWTQEMNYALPEYDMVASHKAKITAQYEKSKNLLGTIMRCFWKETLIIMVAQFILSFVTNYGVAQMSLALKLISALPLYKNFENIKEIGLRIIAGTLIRVVYTIGSFNFQFYSQRVSLAIRSSLFSIMQDKIMKFSCLNSDTITQGFIADLIQVDVVFLNQIYYNIFLIFGTVVGIFTSLGFLMYYLGLYQTLIYLGVLMFLLLIYYVSFTFEAWVRKKYLEAKDKRMSLLRNILENVDYVKINGMENYFCLEMFERREGEIFWMKVQAYVTSFKVGILQLINNWIPCMIFNAIWFFFPVFDMDIAKFYQFFNYNKFLTNSLGGTLTGYNYFLKMMVSVKRIDSFLQGAEEKEPYVQELGQQEKESGIALKIFNGNFKWRMGKKQVAAKEGRIGKKGAKSRDSEVSEVSGASLLVSSTSDSGLFSQESNFVDSGEEFMLRNVKLSVRKGEKIAVIGRSSSGTSSLLYAMIGEMVPVGSAKVLKSGNISYLSQGRWLMGGSVKENILLGKEYDQKLLRKALEAADLLLDLDQFTDGIETILSDNGDSVSGGQRARIALARCFYQE